jgi:hypothetical protein
MAVGSRAYGVHMRNRPATPADRILADAARTAAYKRALLARSHEQMNAALAAGASYREIAAAVGLSPTTVFYAINGRRPQRPRLNPAPAPAV